MSLSILRKGSLLLGTFPRFSKSGLISLLVPSFLQPRRENAKVSPTAWLDGMRGIAAFLVYIRHFAAASHPDIQYGWGTNGEHHTIIQLPFLHLLTAGPAMVALFFIISGYALSLGPLRAIHNQSVETALVRLSSATFRRAARLFLPGVVSTFVVMICIALGLYDRGFASMNSEDMPGFLEPQPPMVNDRSFSEQFMIWLIMTWRWLDVWNPGNHPYDVHLWTLPVEFRCSVILFMALVAFARTRPRARLGMLFGCIAYCHYTNAWEAWLFFAGSFLAQLKMLQEEANSPPPPLGIAGITGDISEEKHEKPTSKMDHARLVIFVAGLYLLSSPDIQSYALEEANEPSIVSCAPGYCILSSFSPLNWPEPFRFLHCIGAFLVVYATSSSHTSTLRSFFDNSFSVYLGKISFALYLVHGPVVHMLGFWFVPWCWKWSGKEILLHKEIGFGMAFVVVTIFVVWAADVFWRVVDQKCVAFARWCEQLVMVTK
jgi:peptidoglycan/LPS O-acetylase OafA/YrhL